MIKVAGTLRRAVRHFNNAAPWTAAPQRNALSSLLLLLLLTGALAPAAAQPSPTASIAAPRRPVLVDIEEEIRQQTPDPNNANVFNLTPETLDQWVFNASADMARQNYETLLRLEIEQIDAACELSPEQKEMLQLAGAGEMQRIREGVAQLQAQFGGRTYDQERVGEIFQQIQPLREVAQRRPLDESSLVFKLLRTTLEPPQREQLTLWLQGRQRAELRRQIDRAVAAIEQHVPLRNDQRQALIELLEKNVRAVADATAQRQFGLQAETVVLAQMNDIEPKEFRAFLKAPQWEALQQRFLRERGARRMLQQLQQRGLLLDPFAAPVADPEVLP